MRTYLMAGNWKMNKTIPETVVLTQQLCNQYNRKWDNVDIVLCPPAIDIKAAYTVLDFDKTNISSVLRMCTGRNLVLSLEKTLSL